MNRASAARAFALAAALVVGGASFAGCHKKSATATATAELTGLGAVPASAEVVVAIDVPRVAGSPLVERAIDQLFSRDADLSARWEQLRASCKLDVKNFKHVVLAIGPHGGAQPGTGPVLVVATGALVEHDFAACVKAMVGKGGGDLTAKDVGGRTLYQARDGSRFMSFAFGRPDTVVMGSNEAYVIEALGAGAKAADDPTMKQWIALADQKAPIWAAGKVDDRVRQGLVRVTGGQLTAGPAAMVISLDPTSGAHLQIGAVMASPADAKTLETFAKGQIAMLGMVAQAKSLGTIVDHVKIAADGAVVRFDASLSPAEVNQLVSVLDGSGAPEQGSAAAPGSGSGGSAQ